VKLDADAVRRGIGADPQIARDVVRGVEHLSGDTGVTLEYDAVDALIRWLLVIAEQALKLEESH
jgi:hypothetical protein